jgi:hypothetical protein
MQQSSNPSGSGAGNANNDAGFSLPGNEASAAASAAAASAAAASASVPATGSIEGVAQAPQAADTSTRDLTLGGGIFLVLLLAFFFARGAYVNHLVARRVAPSSAGSAGWLLFIGLAFLSASVVLALINPNQYLRWAITAPLMVVGVCTLIGAILTGRR